MRNLVRKNGLLFFLQMADGRFHPDFICKLEDSRIFAVGYKGKKKGSDAADDRAIGGMGEELSGGECLFVMATDKDWAPILGKMGGWAAGYTNKPAFKSMGVFTAEHIALMLGV